MRSCVDSWKQVSALAVASSRSQSVPNKLTLEVLLHGCDDEFATTGFQQETRNARPWAQYVMKEWSVGGKARGK